MQLLAWGANNYGQLGLANESEQEEIPKIVNLNHLEDGLEISSIVGGGGHTVVVGGKGDLLVCGWNMNGQLGLGHRNNVSVLTKVDLGGEVVKEVAAGWDFTILLLDDGSLRCSGSNSFGQLGLGGTSFNSIKQSTEFIPVPNLQNIISIAAGLRHAAAVDSLGRAFTWGSGSKGQLGLGTKLKIVNIPAQIPDLENVRRVLCGQYFTVVAQVESMDCQKISCFGDNKFGQLAVLENIQLLSPKVIAFGSDVGDAICCGWTHVFAIKRIGKQCDSVFSWGRNNYHQLGIGDLENNPKPRHVIAGVQKVVSGSEHGMCLMKNGQVLTWGWNEHGNCGIGTTQNVPAPEPLKVNGGVKFLDIFSGSAHCFATVKSGTFVDKS